MIWRSFGICFTLRPSDLITTLTYILMETFVLVFKIFILDTKLYLVQFSFCVSYITKVTKKSFLLLGLYYSKRMSNF